MGLLALLAVLAVPCPGDVNGDRRVTVAELVQAVNAALDGCPSAKATPTATEQPIPPTPTPPALTGCPVRFTDDNTADDAAACSFAPITTTCGPFALYTDGALAVLEVENATGTYYIGASVTGATDARQVGWWTAGDLSDFHSTARNVPLILSSSGDQLLGGLLGGACAATSIHARYSGRQFPPRSDIRAMLTILGQRAH